MARTILFIVGGLLCGPFLMSSGCSTNSRIAELTTNGVAVNGEVNGGHSSRRRRSSTFKISVTYDTPAHGPMTQDFEVTKEFFKANSDGASMTVATVPIRYRASNPEDAIIVGATPDGNLAFWGGLGMLIVLPVLGAVNLKS